MPGVQHWYYTAAPPDRGVTLAEISATPSRPADLTDINDVVTNSASLQAGALTAVGYPSQRTFDAKTIGNPIAIFGSSKYVVQNQFFELTDTSLDGTAEGALFYAHSLPPGVADAAVLDDAGNQEKGFLILNGRLYHSMDGGVRWVQYYLDRVLKKELLRYTPAIQQAAQAGATTYSYLQSVLLVADVGKRYIRFVEPNGYRVLPPYGALLNDPWYARVRFIANPIPPEWARQIFLPGRPYQMATWVPGQILDAHVIEFERKNVWFDGARYPDVLVFDANHKFKYAIDGSPVNSVQRKGYLYPWKRAQFVGLDPAKARVNVTVDLAPDDIAYGFYFYAEPDYVFRALDVNPYTNPNLKDRVVEFYYADRSIDTPPLL